MKNLTRRWTTQLEPYFPKLRHFFWFSEKDSRGLPPLILVALLPCLDKAKFNTVNSDLTNFLDVQHLHENIKWIMCFSLSLAILCLQKRSCSSTFLNQNVSFIEELIHLGFSLVQQLLSRLPRIRLRQYLFISSVKSFLPPKLSTLCPQEKSYLPDWFRILDKLVEETLSPIAYVTEWTFIGL